MQINNVEITDWQLTVLKEALKDAEVKYGQTVMNKVLAESSNNALVSIRMLNRIMDISVEQNED